MTGERAVNERTVYDRQLTDRFGSVTAFLIQRTSPEPTDWGPVLDYERIAAGEAILDKLRARVHRLVTLPDLTARDIDRLTDLVATMVEALALREEHTVFLRLALDLPAAMPPADGDDPYADLRPNPLPHQQPAPQPTGTAPAGTEPTAAAALDDRVIALVGSRDQLTGAEHDPRAHQDTRRLAFLHRLATDTHAAAAGIQAHLAPLTDGRWYPDGTLMAVLDGTITALGQAVDRRDTARRRLAAALDPLEAAAQENPALRAAPAERAKAPQWQDTARPAHPAPAPPPPGPPGTPPPRSR